MNRSYYQKEVKKANLELRLAKARLAYYDYLFVGCDLYADACHFIVNDLRIPEKMDGNEAIECRKHIDKIAKIESLINKIR